MLVPDFVVLLPLSQMLTLMVSMGLTGRLRLTAAAVQQSVCSAC